MECAHRDLLLNLLGARLAHAQQPGATGIDLIDQHQELLTLADMDFVEADGAQAPSSRCCSAQRTTYSIA